MAGDTNKFETAMTHARRFSQQGNWANAMKAYRFALAEFSNNEAAIVGFGEAALASGQEDFARKAFQQALKVNPSNYQALQHLGNLQESAGELNSAAETYLRIGNIFSARDEHDQAIEFWSHALELVPDHIDAHHNLVQVYTQQEQTRLAAHQLLLLAATYQQRGDKEKTAEQIESARVLLPDEPGIDLAMEALQQDLPINAGIIGEEAPFELEMASDFSDLRPGDVVFEGDPFDIEEPEPAAPRARGLVEQAHQEAIASLANVIFEDENESHLSQTGISKEAFNRLIIQAIDLQSREELSEAISHYRQVVNAGVERPALYFNLGLLYKEQGNFEEAIRILEKAADYEAYQLSAQFALGETYYAANEPVSAVQYFIAALKIIDLETLQGKNVAQVNESYERVVEEYTTGRDMKKIDSFVTALQAFFSNPDWERNVYEARQRMNSVSEDGVVMSLAEYLETPETAVVITAVASTGEYMKRNMLLTASEACLWSIQRASSYLPLHIRLAEILLKQERTDEAITKYLYIAKVYQVRNQPDQAVNIYQKILRLASMDVTVRSKLIDIYTSHDQIEEALDQYLILADSYYQLAQVDRALEKYNEALRLSTNVSNADRWKVQILSHMGDIYNQRFDWTRAIQAFEELIKIRPNEERIQRQLIDLYFKRNRAEDAVAVLKDLLGAYEKQGQSARALEVLQELSSTYPENLSLRQHLARFYVKNDMRREAISEYDALGEMQLEKGLRRQAMETIQTIIELGPDDVEGYHRLLSKISGGGV